MVAITVGTMWLAMVLTAVVVPVGSASAAVVSARAASVQAPYILLTPSTAIAAESVKVTGKLPGVYSRPVWVQRKAGTTWVTLVKTITSTAGSYATSFRAPLVGSYAVRSLAPQVTVARKVRAHFVTPAKTLTVVNQSGSLSMPTTLVQAKTGIATVKFAPVRAGRAVALQVLRAAVWRTVGATGRQSSAGTSSFTVTSGAPGNYSYRAWTAAVAGVPAFASPTKNLRVTARVIPLAITTSSLKNAVAGLRYQEIVAGTGGRPPYRWTAMGLPDGLALSSEGVLTGTPVRTGSSQVRLTVTDASLTVSTKALSLGVPTALPANCASQSCAILKPDGETLQIPATRIGAITLAADGSATQVLLTGPAPTIGQILVLAPTVDAPTGLIVVVNSVTANIDGTSLLDVSAAGLADAYSEGTVQARGAPLTPATLAPAAISSTPALSTLLSAKAAKSKAASTLASPRTNLAGAAPSLECNNNASNELHGLDVKPTLTPTVAALWKHPVFGGGGIYVGTGGLDLFQLDLDGDITVNVGVSVSGAANCHLTLPRLRTAIPAGNLGAVIVQLDPSVDLTVSGKVDVRTSVTLHCGVEYRWSQGQEYRTAYCQHRAQPLQLSSDSGVVVTAAATMAASVSVNGIAGVTGSITPSVRAAYTPAAHPIATLSAKAGFDIGVCLACLWKGSPAHASIVSGTIFDKIVATYDVTPEAVPPTTNPVITTTSLPSGATGQPYSVRLTTSDNRNGAWDIASGALPDGLILTGDTLSGRPTAQGRFALDITFTDTGGRIASRSYTVLVGNGVPATSGAIQNLDYCRQNVLARNDDNSTDTVALPFDLNFFGTTYSTAYVSNNGYIRLDSPAGDFTPYPLVDTSNAIVAPFFADVDTRNEASALVTYGSSPDGKTFCVNWVGVGYYDSHMDKMNSFQLLLVNRGDVGTGDFDMVFNYGSLGWETGDASGGIGGIGGTSARAGYSAGTTLPGTSFELPGSGDSGALMDGGTSPLGASSQGSNSFPGRYTFPVRN